MTKTYRSQGYTPIRSTDPHDTMTDAAKIFATRTARKEFGRSGYCRTLRMNSYSASGDSATFEAFIGKDLPRRCGGNCQGHNIWLTVNVSRG